jgi:hypothetical protein
MSQCGDRSFKFGKLCFSVDDYYMIIFNIIMSLIIVAIFNFKKTSDLEKNLSVPLKHNFTPLGEGNLNNFYFSTNSQQKSTSTKKKVQTKSGAQNPIVVEKVVSNNNELKCNSCGRSVEVSYLYTMNKLNATL